MSSLRCGHCGWQQEDWWTEDCNPIAVLKPFSKWIVTADLDRPVKPDAAMIQDMKIEGRNPTARDTVRWQLKRAADRIRLMPWPTEANYRKKNPEGRCPKCKQPGLVMEASTGHVEHAE